jgi:iron(III) transport system permease protein
LHDFGAVSLLRYDTFTSAIYLQYRGAFDRSAAAILSLVLILLSTMVVAGELRTRKAVHYHRVHSSGTRTARPVALGKWKWPAFAVCTVLSITALGVPLAVIGYWLARGISQGEPLRLTATAAWGSIQASALGAALVVAAAIPVAFLSVRHPSRTSRFVERSTYIGYALPGIVVALALVFFGIRVARPLYQTMAMLAFAYLVLFLPLASGNVRSSLLQMNPRLEDAARVLGSGKIRTLTRVVLPLMKPGILTAAALTFLTAMKELPATLLLAPIGYSTLATQVWNATSEAFFARAAAPALALIALASVPLALLVAREEAPI